MKQVQFGVAPPVITGSTKPNSSSANDPDYCWLIKPEILHQVLLCLRLTVHVFQNFNQLVVFLCNIQNFGQTTVQPVNTTSLFYITFLNVSSLQMILN